MKKFLSLFLSLAMVFAILPTGLFSVKAKAATSGYYTYTVTDGEATIEDVDTSISGAVTIPSTLNGYPVASIGHDAFSGCKTLTSIIIPDSVTSIGNYAFSGCTSLTGVNIPDGVTSIGISVFEGCTSLTGVNIPNSVTSIGISAFEGCASLTSIAIPDSVETIGDRAFCDCDNLINISIGNSVTSIGNYAFWDCDAFKSIIIPNSVTSIGDYAFAWCKLFSSVTIGNGINNVDESVFYRCNNLKTVYFYCDRMKKTTTIRGILTKVSCELIHRYNRNGICSDCGYEEIEWVYTVSNSKATITGFIGTLKGNVIVPKKLGGYPVTNIKSNVFSNCTTITSITIPDSVATIEDYAFSNCTSLTSIIIPTVSEIGYGAFYNCTSLKSIEIGAYLWFIDDYAFYNCTSLECVYFNCGASKDYIAIGAYNDALINATWKNNGHNEYYSQSNPTCTGKGDDVRYIFCFDCDYCENIVDIDKGPLGHRYAAVAVTKATCYQKGYTIYACERCGDTYKGNFTAIDSRAHNYVIESVTEPTCTELGYTTYICKKCGGTYIGNYTNTKHNYSEVVTPPTCLTDGFTTYTCTDCGDSYKGNSVEGGHSYEGTVIPPTPVDKGYTLYTCTVCGHSYKGNYVEAKYAISGVKADCSDIGVTLSWDAFDGAVKYFATVCAEDGTSIKTIVTTENSAFFDSNILEYYTNYKFYVLAQYDGEKYLRKENATKVDGAMVIGNRVVGHTATIKGRGAEISFLPAEGATEYYAYVFENDVNGTRVYTRQVPIGTTSVFIENNIVAGTKYFVLINPRINGKFLSTEELKATAVGVTFTAPVYNPTSVTVVDQTATSIRFNWDNVRGATQYFIKVTEKATGKVVNTLNIVGKTTATLARHTDGTRISPNTTYILQFYTYINSTSNAGAYGEPIEITTIDFEPVTVTARYNQNNNKINVSWNKTTNAVGYYLCFFKNGVETNVKYIDGGDKTFYEFTAPKDSGTYSYGIRVYEKNSSGTAYSPISMSNAIYM